MDIKCEIVNRMIGIPYCIWCNFTYNHDYCRWIVYDESVRLSNPGGISRACGYKRVGFFNYFRDPSLNDIEFEEGLDPETILQMEALFPQQKFEDYTDHEKEWIKNKYANHLSGHSLMLYKECPEEEKKAILSRLVHLHPHPCDEKGPIPLYMNKAGEVKPWPRRDGQAVSVYELD